MEIKKYINEIWKDIPGYEGLYQVSNFGRVRSLNYKRSGKTIIIKQWKNNNGYLNVSLYNMEHKGKNHLVHRLVAEAFIDNPNKLPCINHKNEIKTDNRACNLEWCDIAYNNTYNGRSKKVAEKKSKQINQYTIEGVLVKTYQSIHEAARETNVNRANLSQHLQGKRFKSVGGYVWRYVE